MSDSEPSGTDDGIRATASIVRLESRPAVCLEITSTRDGLAVVTIAHALPSGVTPSSVEPMAAGQGIETVALPAGQLTVRAVIEPSSTLSLTYLLDAEPEQPLPAPTVEEVVAVSPEDGPAAPELRWVTDAGERLVLTARDPATHPLGSGARGLLVEAAASQAGDPVAEAELSAATRARDPTDRPAIGIIATPENADAIYGAILRAQERGFQTLVACTATVDEEVPQLARRLGAIVEADSSVTQPSSEAQLEHVLSKIAKQRGHPGIVFQTAACPRIDFEATIAAFDRGGFEVRAVPEDTEHRTQGAVLVGIPAYNSEGTIADIVQEARQYCDEVLVVDDGSEDRTAQRAREAGASVVIHRRNRGYGGALKTTFREAAQREITYLITLDADGQHDPGDIPRLIEGQRSTDADVVVGSRFVTGSTTRVPLVRAVGLSLVNALTNLSLGRFRPRAWLRDTQSGYRLYSGDAVESLTTAADIGDGMWASTDIIYHLTREQFTFTEIGTTIRYDLENTSSEGAVSHGIGLVRNIFGMLEHTHPLVLVGAPGLLAVFVGTLLGVSALQQALGGAPSVALTVTAILVVLLGVILIGTATLLHTINTHPFFRNDRWED
jgi:hypothetical protein